MSQHRVTGANAPRPRETHSEGKSLTKVQRWVMSSLAVITILHLSAGMIAGAWSIDAERSDARGAKIGLCIIAGGFGIVAIAAFRAIHAKGILSPWLLLGLIPIFVGLWLVL
jgi:hypothetical protein